MSDEHERFNWPPTAEELDSIHVIAMPDESADSRQLVSRQSTPPMRVAMPLVTPSGEHAPSAWRRLVDSSMVAQMGLLTASLAAIGIAVTSLLAPAQPAASTGAKHEPRPALATRAPAPLTATTSHAVSSEFPQLITFAPPPREESPWFQGQRAKSPAVAPRLLAPDAREKDDGEDGEKASPANDVTPVTPERAVSVHVATSRPLDWRWGDRRAARRATAGSDPVSRFAVQTGTSLWKALRVVGRSLRRDDDERVWASRPKARAAIARRTATAVDLEGGSAPSAR